MFCSCRASSLLSFWRFTYQGLSSGWSMVNHYDMQLLLHESHIIFLIFDGSLQTVKVCWSYCINPSVKRFRPGEDKLKNNNIFSELAGKIYYTCLKNQFIKMTKKMLLFLKKNLICWNKKSLLYFSKKKFFFMWKVFYICLKIQIYQTHSKSVTKNFI